MRTGCAGFSLLEIIIAMLILSIVTAGSFSLYVTSQKHLTGAEQRLDAVNKAATVLEKLRFYVSENPDYPVNADNALAYGEGLSPTIIGLDPQPGEMNNGQWFYEVTDDEDPTTDWKVVTVAVTWDE